MQKIVLMSEVAECTVPECGYNRGSRCYARAITVGDGGSPGCHTFFTTHARAQRKETTAGVGACRAYPCRHNDAFDCTANRIYVGYGGAEIVCLSYSEF